MTQKKTVTSGTLLSSRAVEVRVAAPVEEVMSRQPGDGH